MAKLTKGEGQLELSLRGHPDFTNALEAVKAVSGRRFDPDTKNWCFPEDPMIAERLMVTVRPEVSAEVLSWVKATKAEKQKELVTPLPKDADITLPWAKNRVSWQPEWVDKDQTIPFNGLYGYQRAFIDMAAGMDEPERALFLADDMGAGKCGQAAGAITEFQLRRSDMYSSGLSPNGTPMHNVTDLLHWYAAEDGPKLIICPNSVKGTWARELRMWLGQDVPLQIVEGTQPKRKKQILQGIADNGWVIVNWDQLRVKREEQKRRKKVVNRYTGEFLGWADKVVSVEVMREPLFSETEWLAVVADEAHRAKNRDALQTRGLWKVSGRMRLALTGTPLMNSPDELWPLLRWLYPDQYGDSTKTQKKTPYWSFYNEYVEFYEGQYGKIITGVNNPDALRFELKGRLVRRTKDEILPDLPPKTRTYVPLKMKPKQRKLYEEAEKAMWLEVEQAIAAGDKDALKFAKTALENPAAIYTLSNGASRIVRLQQIASTPALLGGEDESIKMDWAEEKITIDSDPGRQWVVFTKFKGTCEILVQRLQAKGFKAAFYNGDVDSERRTALENDFQNGEIQVIVGTIAAMKEGITLTSASDEIFFEREWTPAPNEQAEDRCHRIGQKDHVNIYILECEDSVDTQNVKVRNILKSLIVSSVIAKDEVEEVHG